MSELSDLKAVGDELVPIVKKLFDLANRREKLDNPVPEDAVIARLKKVIDEAGQPTRGDLLARAEAVLASKEALGEIIVEASTTAGAISSTQLRILEAQHNALGASFGRLLEQSAFAAIPKLLDDDEIRQLNANLAAAKKEIEDRQMAKDILDVTVNIALTSAKIATRLA
jgi:hypothetical protein